MYNTGSISHEGIPRMWQGKSLCHVWEYRDETRAVLGRVARFDDCEGGKVVVPFF